MYVYTLYIEINSVPALIFTDNYTDGFLQSDHLVTWQLWNSVRGDASSNVL